VVLVEIGEEIYSLIGDYGNPLGGSSTAIIAGLGMRLINESLRLSNIDFSIDYEIKQCFLCCDDDHELLMKSLHGEAININEATVHLFHNIVSCLEKTTKFEDNVVKKVLSDYQLGVNFCICAANACIEIMKTNEFAGIATSDMIVVNQKIFMINELSSRSISMKTTGLKQNTIVANSNIEGGNSLLDNRQTPSKPDDRSDNVEKIQDMIEHTIENIEQAEDTLRNPEIDMHENERQQIEEKNDRRRDALDSFRAEVKDEARYNGQTD
jgi:small acid-soluble spore protein (thioredoxin-like protein)